ncbi:MAG TPA: sigma 54-interacting transcriptional regulator, partial [Enhygromyxa sp.]|nr:sigma 54-interacting transcriptional regulator [Enhygromyxa sp.]
MQAPARLLAAVAMATHETHVERMLIAVADAFASALPLERLELVEPNTSTITVRPRKRGGWQLTRASSTRSRPVEPELALELDDGARLHLHTSKPPPSWLADAELRRAIAQLLARGRKSQLIVQRLADASRRAHTAKRELERSVDVGPSPVARSEAMRELLARARAVAGYPTTVLITGESGVGKEIVASFIHANSTRARGPFVRINCGALPETLAESELFGHEPGAFTGASRRHRGVFERAHRGTLFLDEIGELPLHLQVKLLRTLQSGELTRVGGEQTVEVDVRVIAATNRPLDAMIADGRFRADLFFRLSVFPLVVPPLRERKPDIPPLIEQLLDELGHRFERPRPHVDESTLTRLINHPWPGNVRELANALEAAMIVSHDGRLRLPDSVHHAPPIVEDGPCP